VTTLKAIRSQVTNLSARTPREILAVPWDASEPVSSEATVYASLSQRTGATVAVRLVAGLLGHRQLVGQAGIPPGFSGIAVIASGICADAWHVEAFGTLLDAKLDVALGVRPCCSGFAVQVPALLQQNVPLINPLTPALCMPLNRADGRYELVSGDAGTENLIAGERVLRLVVTADPLLPATVSGVSLALWAIPIGETRELQPRGNLEGPRDITFVNTTFYSLETVR
jgi:hypothetical protein